MTTGTQDDKLGMPAWIPSADFIRTTNIGWLMRRAGVDSYEALHTWSARHRESYWSLAIERLDIRFRKPFSRVMDPSRGVEEPRWLPDGQLNIFESCFAAPAEAPSIIHQAQGGPLETLAIAISPGGGPSRLVIYVVLRRAWKSSRTSLLKAMQETLKRNLNPLFKIHDLVLVDSLPRTPSNKVMRRVLRDGYPPRL